MICSSSHMNWPIETYSITSEPGSFNFWFEHLDFGIFWKCVLNVRIFQTWCSFHPNQKQCHYLLKGNSRRPTARAARVQPEGADLGCLAQSGRSVVNEGCIFDLRRAWVVGWLVTPNLGRSALGRIMADFLWPRTLQEGLFCSFFSSRSKLLFRTIDTL